MNEDTATAGTNWVGSLGVSGVMYIVLTLICIAFAWKALQQVRWDVLLRLPDSAWSKMLVIMLSIVLGYGLSSFILSYWGWTVMMKSMF